MSSEVRTGLERIGLKILESSRRELYVSMHFLGDTLFRFRFQMDLGADYLGTDGECLFFQPRFLAEYYEEDPVFVNRSYLHSVLHCIFRHIYQEDKRFFQEELSEPSELWDLACDIAVEYLIDTMDDYTVRKLPSMQREEAYEHFSSSLKVMTAEGVFYCLEKENYARIVELKREFRKDDHRCWQGRQEDNKKKEQQEEKPGKEWEKAADDLSARLIFEHGIGRKAGELSERLGFRNIEKCSLRDFLKRFAVFGEELKIDEASFDYAYYCYGLEHYGNLPLIEPLEYREVKKTADFVIALDTSASCQGNLIRRFLKEAWSVLSEKDQFFEKVNIHVIQCDAKIQSDVQIKEAGDLERLQEHLELKGFGGTDFRPVFEYVNSLMEKGELTKLKGLMYFTDGYGTYPVNKPPYETAFIFAGEDKDAPEVPAWALKGCLTEQMEVVL